MSEWHVSFHTIENEWTEREFVMMVCALQRRKSAEEKELKKTRARKGRQAQPYS
jgi:hypothetical protein